MAKNISERDRFLLSKIEDEVNQWHDATAFVTEDIAFNMRNMIKTFRKNYLGIFDKEFDSATGRRKTWVPLTESTVDAVRKNIDLDTKDINFRAKRHDAIGLTQFVRNLVRANLDENGFGEKLDEFITRLAIDGTAIWKTVVTQTKGGKKVDVHLVDTLNFYIDPVARNIQEADVIERAAKTVSEIKMMDGWENVDEIHAEEGVSRNEKNLSGTEGVELVDVYERWGKLPRWVLQGKTGNKDKDEEMVETHVVVSGIDGTTGPLVHLVEENDTEDSEGSIIKPYEEAWYSRVPGRWYGRGPAEKVMFLQVWINTIVNIRINRSRVSQLGIFKLRKGAGVTPQMLSGLTSNGVVVLNNMDDLQQLPVQEASQASYNDEQVIKNWAQVVTSTFDTATGDNLPASTPATNAVIQSRATQSQFSLVKEQVGMFLQRWMKRHYIPLLAKTLKKNQIMRITGEMDEIRDMDEKIANKLVKDKMLEVVQAGKLIDPAQVRREKERVIAKLQSQGKDRFIKLMQKPDMTAYDVQVFITNEEQDKGVMVQNLISMLQTSAQLQGTNLDPTLIAEAIFDIMGIDAKQFERKQTPQPATPAAPQQALPQGARVNPIASPTQQVTEANLPV